MGLRFGAYSCQCNRGFGCRRNHSILCLIWCYIESCLPPPPNLLRPPPISCRTRARSGSLHIYWKSQLNVLELYVNFYHNDNRCRSGEEHNHKVCSGTHTWDWGVAQLQMYGLFGDGWHARGIMVDQKAFYNHFFLLLLLLVVGYYIYLWVVLLHFLVLYHIFIHFCVHTCVLKREVFVYFSS